MSPQITDVSLPSLVSGPATPIGVNGSDNEFICSEGYSENEFQGKADQMEQVVAYIKEKGFLPESLVENEVTWFYKYLIYRLAF